MVADTRVNPTLGLPNHVLCGGVYFRAAKSQPFVCRVIQLLELAAGGVVADDAGQGPELDPNLDVSADNACGIMRGIAGSGSSPVGNRTVGNYQWVVGLGEV